MELKETIDITTLIPVGVKDSPLMTLNEVKNLKEVGYRKTGIDPDTGLEVLQLDNGVKLMLDLQEPNGNASESISIRGSAPRGASCFPEEDYYSAISATEIVKFSGAGGFDKKTIQNKLGREFSRNLEPVQLHIKSNYSTVSTRAKLENLEKHLQLIYLYYTSPREDSLAFAEWQAKIRQRYFAEDSPVNPRTDFKNSIADFLDVSDFKSATYLMSTEQFYQKQNVQLNKAIELYQAIFGNASDFTFVIQGKYEKDQVLPLLQKYLGNLPADYKTICSTRDNIDKTDFKLPYGPIYHTFYADKMNTAYKLYTSWYNLSFVFPIVETNWKDRVVLDFINIYLFSKVNYNLRRLKGLGVYGPLTEGYYSEKDGLYSLAFYVDGLENELEQIKYVCKAMIDDLKGHGLSLEAKKRVLRDPIYKARFKSTPVFQKKVNQYVKSLNADDFKTVAVKYLIGENRYEFIFKDK